MAVFAGVRSEFFAKRLLTVFTTEYAINANCLQALLVLGQNTKTALQRCSTLFSQAQYFHLWVNNEIAEILQSS